MDLDYGTTWWEDEEARDFDGSRLEFANPGSALRAGKRIYPCPTCGEPNLLTAKDKSLGYQCDACADRAEGGGY